MLENKPELSTLGQSRWNNQISDISPLVQNEGLVTGDFIGLRLNPLSEDFINIGMPQLETRKVIVDYLASCS